MDFFGSPFLELVDVESPDPRALSMRPSEYEEVRLLHRSSRVSWRVSKIYRIENSTLVFDRYRYACLGPSRK